MDEIRISDTARYTTTFTPSTTAFTADANTLLLIHSDFNGGLGQDISGNKNDFAVTNLVATDQMVDSPTNNFCTLNPLVRSYDTPTYSEGNLQATGAYALSSYGTIAATMSISSGKWYWEVYQKAVGYVSTGIKSDLSLTSIAVNPQDHTGTINYYTDGTKRIDGTSTSYGATYATGDIVGVALDLDSGTQTITFYKNNSTQGSITISGGCASAASVVPEGITLYTTDVVVMNFGQDSSFAGNKTAQGNQDSNSIGDFYYEPPTDYLALCTSNLASPEIALPTDYFNTLLYTGTGGSGQSLTGVGFQPDMMFLKRRDAGSTGWGAMDVVRGAEASSSLSKLTPNAATAEESSGDTYDVISFDSDGFTVGEGYNLNVNVSSGTYATWNWKAGGTAASNTDGTITSSVSANTTAGFSIVSYTGEDNAGDTVGHGLTQTPELIIVKDLTSAEDWQVYDVTGGPTKYIQLNDTGDYATDTTRWNDTAPSASVFSLGTSDKVNDDGDNYIAYCFHSVEGYSKVGSYEGNGNLDGAFVYTGFRPAFVMTKSVDSTSDWQMFDNKRAGYNVDNYELEANDSAAEDTSTEFIDIVSNGFKNRDTTDPNVAETYIYLAFAESPFKYSNAR
jgi:hypothetical protein